MSGHCALPCGAVTFLLNLSVEDVSIVPAELYVEFEWVFKDTPRGIWYILISTSALPCVTGTEGSGKIRRHMSVCTFIPS